MAGSQGGGPPDGADNEAMRARLDKLSNALEARRDKPSSTGGGRAGNGSGGESGGAMAKGMRATSELVGGVLVGGFVGWQLDAWLGTKPWLLILFFLLGVIAGFWNVMRGAFAPTGGLPPEGRDDRSPDAGA